MVPSGEPTKSTINELSSILDKNDIIIDGGNSFYKESVKTSSEFWSNSTVEFELFEFELE